MSTATPQPLPLSADLEAMYDALETLPEDLAAEMMAQFIYQIGRRMDELDWNQKTLAEEMGMRPPQLSRLLKADNTSLLTIARAAHALDLAFGALKLIPVEDLELQEDEVAAFVRTESTDGAWWPATRRSTQAWGRKRVEPTFASTPLPKQIPRPTDPETQYAEGTEVGAFLRRTASPKPRRPVGGAGMDRARTWQSRQSPPRSRGTNPAATAPASATSPDLAETAYEQCLHRCN